MIFCANIVLHSLDLIYPKMQKVPEGSAVFMKCDCTRKIYSWLHNGIVVDTPNRKFIMKENILIIPDVKKTDTGEYRCCGSRYHHSNTHVATAHLLLAGTSFEQMQVLTKLLLVSVSLVSCTIWDIALVKLMIVLSFTLCYY